MSEQYQAPDFLWRLFVELRRRHFLLGPEDYEAVRQAMREGFGWESPQALRSLLCMLWAKSKAEQEVLGTLFEQDQDVPEWELSYEGEVTEGKNTLVSEGGKGAFNREKDPRQKGTPATSTVTTNKGHEEGLPMIPENLDLPRIPLILVPEYPVAEREVAQAWRRFRRAVRIGPPVELDLEETISRRSKQGVAVGVVLRPRRRNTARLLLLVDQYGSMLPYQNFVDMVGRTIRQTSNIQSPELFFFHDVPVQDSDPGVLESLKGELFPSLDRVLADIQPSTNGIVQDAVIPSKTHPLKDVLDQYAGGAAIIMISDAGAARGNYDMMRLLNTIAFLKALKMYTSQIVWLNPVQREDWKYGTAREIKRYVPMFEMDRFGFYQAVDVLRGHPSPLVQPL